MDPFEPPDEPIKPDLTAMNVSDGYLALQKYGEECRTYQAQLRELLKQASNSAAYHMSQASGGCNLP